MSKASERVQQHKKIRERNPHGFRHHYLIQLSNLEGSFTELQKSGAQHLQGTLSYFPISLVTCIEVFFRNAVSDLIDAGKPFIDRIEPLTKDLKFDLEAVKALQGKSITLGEVVSLGPSFQNLETICSVMDLLTASNFISDMSQVYDRAEVEIWGKDKVPMIADMKNTAGILSELFENRHIVVHELPPKLPFNVKRVWEYIQVTKRFLEAADHHIGNTIQPNYPLTQADMTQAAGEDANKAATNLKEVTDKICGMLSGERIAEFEAVQTAWEAQRHALATFKADDYKGGSIRPMIYLNAIADQTDLRTKELRELLEEMQRFYEE